MLCKAENIKKPRTALRYTRFLFELLSRIGTPSRLMITDLLLPTNNFYRITCSIFGNNNP